MDIAQCAFSHHNVPVIRQAWERFGMRASSGFLAFVFSMGVGITGASAQAPTVESVRASSDAFMRAYGSGAPGRSEFSAQSFANPGNAEVAANDHAALVDQFDDNANFAGTLQPFWLRGKAHIGDLWARYFARYPDRRLVFRERDIQVRDNLSVESGYAEMYMGGDATNSIVTFMRYAITRTHQGGTSKIVNMIVDRLPGDQPPPGTMPPWANTPARAPAPAR
jgi:hypothetical protein